MSASSRSIVRSSFVLRLLFVCSFSCLFGWLAGWLGLLLLVLLLRLRLLLLTPTPPLPSSHRRFVALEARGDWLRVRIARRADDEAGMEQACGEEAYGTFFYRLSGVKMTGGAATCADVTDPPTPTGQACKTARGVTGRARSTRTRGR